MLPDQTHGERIRLLLPLPVSAPWQEVSAPECSILGLDSVLIVPPGQIPGTAPLLLVEGVTADTVLVVWKVEYALVPFRNDLHGPEREEAMVPPLEDNHESAGYLVSRGWVSWTDALYTETRSVTMGGPNSLHLLDTALVYIGLFSHDAWPVPLPQAHFENPSLMALRGLRRGSFNASCLLAVMLRTSGIPARVVPGLLQDGPFFICMAYVMPYGWIPADSRSGVAGEMPGGFLSTSYCLTEPPPVTTETLENGILGVVPRGEISIGDVWVSVPVRELCRGFSWQVL